MRRIDNSQMTFTLLYLNQNEHPKSVVMNRKKRFCLSFVVLFLISLTAFSQSAYLPLNQEYNRSLQEALYGKNVRFHTSIRPYAFADINAVVNYDSIQSLLRMNRVMEKKWKQKAWDKLFNDDVVTLYKKDFSLVVNPLMDFSYGHDFVENKNVWINTRGIELKGRIGKNFTFYTNFYENQGVFVNYIDSFILKNKVIPGQGQLHVYLDSTGEHPYLNGKSFDYNSATGYISFRAGKFFTFQLGHGKNFLGDGYRSLLLSDNSFANAYFKMEVNIWHIKYLVLYNQYLDLREKIPEIGYARKYSTIHYLSWAISKRVNLSLFDAIVWQATDTLGNYRGFDWQYLNPVIFLRSVEFSLGSPDNALLGLNLSVIVGKHNVLYGQLLLDEFILKKVMAHSGFWANKQAFQLGFKTFDLLGVKNLYFQTEYNYVRPYTYSESVSRINYGNYNQPLAHPFGSNFWESVNFLKYNYKRLFFNYEFLYSIKGLDPPGKNYGGDIYKSYYTYVNAYGNYVGQGIRTRLLYQNLSVSFLINPAYNLNII
ncbi:MAG: hypothetical protein GXO88_07870 [Chlorobi bacterium]|nr:hypothetical protein [Chlorobiota bacterium]